MLTGQNGILNRAQEAKSKTEQAQKEEKENLGDMEDILNEYTTGIEVEQVTDENPGVLEGTGTSEDPYTINSIEDLVVFASNVTNGTTYEGQTVKLGLSLDFNSNKSYVEPLRTDYAEYGYDGELKTLLTTGDGFRPIGTTYDANISTNYFKGIFDGDYNSVYNIYQNVKNSEYVTIAGLFSTNGGAINNLMIKNANISARTENLNIVIGLICGRNKGTVTNCGSSGNLKITDNGIKSNFCAGITGQAMGTVEKCFSKTNIEVVSGNASTINVGGIAGAITENYIKSCYNVGMININLKADISILVGGITGNNGNKVENCYNAGDINLGSTSQTSRAIQLGSLIGLTGATAKNCFNFGSINVDLLNDSDITYIGNLTGDSYKGIMDNCYNVGKIKLTNESIKQVGQIAGRALSSNFSECFGVTEEDISVFGSEYNNTVDNVELIEKNEIPSILQVLGEDFENDSKNINKTYPILNWQ